MFDAYEYEAETIEKRPNTILKDSNGVTWQYDQDSETFETYYKGRFGRCFDVDSSQVPDNVRSKAIAMGLLTGA